MALSHNLIFFGEICRNINHNIDHAYVEMFVFSFRFSIFMCFIYFLILNVFVLIIFQWLEQMDHVDAVVQVQRQNCHHQLVKIWRILSEHTPPNCTLHSVAKRNISTVIFIFSTVYFIPEFLFGIFFVFVTTEDPWTFNLLV